MSYAVSITQEGTRLETAGKYVDQDIVVGISDSIKKVAATYTPTTADQTIAAGQYLAGAQTVKGDANLVSGNIKQGVSIFGVNGNLTPGITPSGTKSITANGTYDVTEYASAEVNVLPTNFKQWTYTSSGSAAEINTKLVANDDWVRQHYNDENLIIAIRPKFKPTFGAGRRSICFAVGGNKAFATFLDGDYYSVVCRIVTDAGGANAFIRKFKLTSPNDLGDISVDASGNIYLCTYTGSTYMLQAGDWSVTAFLM